MLLQRINMVAPTGKYKGIEGLYDRRGKNKAISQLSDIEKLKAENRLLKAQTQQQQMEIDFLKKLDEIEREVYLYEIGRFSNRF